MAGERGYILGPRAGDEVRDMLRRQGERGQPRTARPRDPLICFVRVTSGTATAGWYPGQWQEVQDDATLADGGNAWVRDAGSGTLTNGARYLSQCVGMDADGVPQFRTTVATAAGFRGFQAKANNLTTTVTSGPVPDNATDWYTSGTVPTFDNIYFETSGDAELSGNTPDIVKINTEGLWYVSAQVLWQSNTNGDRGLAIGQGVAGNKDFIWTVDRAASGGNKMMQRVAGLMLGTLDYYFWIALKQDSGSTLTVYSWTLDGVYLGNYV